MIPAGIYNRLIKSMLYHDREKMLSVHIEYPQIHYPPSRTAATAINRTYRDRAQDALNRAKREMYPEAVDEYEALKGDNYPFRAHELLEKFFVRYNQMCTLSLYTDTLIDTGGAHPNTVRSSDTWALNTGRRQGLTEFFDPAEDAETIALAAIQEELTRRMAEEEGAYFDDAIKLSEEYFSPEQFYLKPEGVVLYYQAYDIAPYSTGIVEFLLPFDAEHVLEPRGC